MANQKYLDDLDVIGLEESKARKYCSKNGWHMRVVKRDGNYTVCTRDYRTDRLNVIVENDVVSDIQGVG